VRNGGAAQHHARSCCGVQPEVVQRHQSLPSTPGWCVLAIPGIGLAKSAQASCFLMFSGCLMGRVKAVYTVSAMSSCRTSAPGIQFAAKLQRQPRRRAMKLDWSNLPGLPCKEPKTTPSLPQPISNACVLSSVAQLPKYLQPTSIRPLFRIPSLLFLPSRRHLLLSFHSPLPFLTLRSLPPQPPSPPIPSFYHDSQPRAVNLGYDSFFCQLSQARRAAKRTTLVTTCQHSVLALLAHLRARCWSTRDRKISSHNVTQKVSHAALKSLVWTVRNE
jgi:hypothetical protein